MTDISNLNLPPGPPGRCLIKNLGDVDTNQPHVSFTKISAEYGDVFSLNVVGKTLVVVNTLEAFRELYGQTTKYGEHLSGREVNFYETYISAGKDVTLSQSSQGFRTRRAVLYSSTTDFAIDKMKLQYDELKKLSNYIGEKSDVPQDLAYAVKLYLTALCLTALTGEQYEYTDPRLLTTIQKVDVMQSLLLPGTNGLLSILPSLRFLPFGYGATYRETIALTEKLKEMIFNPQKETFDSDHIRGGIDCLLKAQQASGKDDEGLSDDCLWASALSTVGAGTGVVVGPLLYFFVVILHKPEVAKRIQSEIDATVGRGRLPRIEDRSSMHYTEAAVLELFRWGSPTPLLVPRRVEEDIQFRNYKIPKDTSLFVNVWKIPHDEAMWEDPWNYNPERFLDSSGNIVEQLRENIITFGGGERKCMGQLLSTNTAFLFMTGLLQKFEFQPAPGDLPSLDLNLHTHTNVGLKPEPFKVVVKPRNTDK